MEVHKCEAVVTKHSAKFNLEEHKQPYDVLMDTEQLFFDYITHHPRV